MKNYEFVTKYFKIKNTKTGKFSAGGMSPEFTKKGKSWKSMRDIKSHLSLVRSWHYDNYVNECELIKYELIKGEVIITNLGRLIDLL